MLRPLFGKLVALALVVAATVVAVALAEVGLRLAVSPVDFMQATLVEDPALGRRIQPLTTGHDALGFRNREVPQHADIVAIGDSNTYGVSAPREGSWPHQLSGLLGEPVYNMGLGGFGPLQYLYLAQVTAKPLRPRLWVVGVYFGNDLMDAYYVAHGQPYWHAWRQSAAGVGDAVGAQRVASEEPRKRFAALRDWLARKSMLYAVLRATVFQRLASQEREQIVRQSSPDARWAWADPANADVRTVFTPQGRLSALDLDDPRVREGLQISQRALAALQAEADQQGVRLLTVLIPTKERAYCAYLKAANADLPPSFAKLCDAESRAKAELVRMLQQQRVMHVDVTGVLEAQIAQHVQLYPTDSDGHLRAAGYGVVAKAIAQAVRQYAPKP